MVSGDKLKTMKRLKGSQNSSQLKVWLSLLCHSPADTKFTGIPTVSGNLLLASGLFLQMQQNISIKAFECVSLIQSQSTGQIGSYTFTITRLSSQCWDII